MKKIYDGYPLWIALLVNILMLSVYISGTYIMFRLNTITGVLYVAFLIFLEFRNFREGCINCCYYGRLCAFGKGAVAALFLKKGNPAKFSERELKWKDFIPQILVVLIPVIAGAALLISKGFDPIILTAMIYPVLSWFALNPIIYGKLACRHCKQGHICCPALKFFSKGN